MPKRKRKGKTRADGEGTIIKETVARKDGSTYERWRGAISLGYRADGSRNRVFRYGKTQAEVREKLEALKHQVRTGTLIEDKRSLESYLRTWLEHKELVDKPRTVEYYAGYCRRNIIPELGTTLLTKLTPEIIRNFMQTVHKQVSSDCANKCRETLHVALNQALQDGLIIRNPVTATKPLKVERKSMDVEWSAAEVVMFLEAAMTHRLYAAFYLAISTGMRHGEVIGVRWQDIDGDILHVNQNLITVKHRLELSTPKTERGKRFIALDPETVAVLEAHRLKQKAEKAQASVWRAQRPELEGLVFTNTQGGALNPRNFSRVWYDLQAKAQKTYVEAATTEEENTEHQKHIDEGKVLKRIRFHDLRHMHVSLLHKAGIDARTISDRIGHSNPAFTLQRYAHVFKDQRKEAAIPLHKLLIGGDGEAN